MDPKLVAPMATVAWKLARRKLGFRTLLDVIPLDTSLVKGSHGRMPDATDDGPVFATSDPELLTGDTVPATAVKHLVLDHVFR
jgi:hypothetical protein